MTDILSTRVKNLAQKVGYEMHNFNCGNIDNTVIDPETEEVTTNFSIEQVISAVNTDFTNSINTAKDDFKEDVHLHALPVGTWIDFGGTEPPSGYLVRDGSAVSRTTYAELFSVIGTTYGEGDGSTTFNLPNSIDYPYTRSVIASEVGKLFEAGLPNITALGSVEEIWYSPIWASSASEKNGNQNGAIKLVSATNDERTYPTDWNAGEDYYGRRPYRIDFNASWCSSIYKDGLSEVRPKSIGSLPCIKALDAPTVTGSTTTIDELMSAVEDIRNNFMLLAHPVGSYYWSSEATDPAELFGGTWEAVTDKFIYASGTHAVGDTGGEETHTLTVAEMPSHNHVVKIFNSNNESGTAMGATGTGWSALSSGAELASGTVSWNSSSFTTVGSGYGDTTGNAMLTGGGGSHNNMPPYEVAYCWRRTA